MMKIERIQALLQEAVTADWKRANAIQCELSNATCAGRGTVDEIGTPAAGVMTLIEHLYVELRQTNPALLPTMLPVFALACGERDNRSFLSTLDGTS
jgi:hypothetical protein